jgi:hypothetical protein
MAVDMRARYFGEFDEGAVPPSFGVLPQAMPQPSAFEVMPMSGAAPIMETSRQATVMPMTQEAVAPMSYEALADRRAAANTLLPGTAIVGPYAGKKGLSFGADNTFDVGADEEVRLVDAKGNVIVSGSGVEGANRAVAAAQSLSDELGKNANFKIQLGERTINPDGTVGGTRYIDVARAAPSQSGLGFLADNVLPFAAAFIPGIGPIAGAALGSAVSSAAQGRGLKDALVRAAIAGGSAYAGGQVFGPATPAASAAPVDKIASAAIPAGSFDGILVNATRAVAPSLAGSAVGGALGSGLSSVTSSNPPPQNLAQQTPADLYAGVEPIDVLAKRLASGSGAPFASAFPVPVNAMLSSALNTTQPAQQNKTAEDIEAERNPMVVTADRPYLSPEALAAIMATFGGGALAATQPTLTQQAKTAEDIEAAKNPINVTGGGLESLTPEELLIALGGVGGLAAATAGGGAGASSTAATQAEDDIIKVTGRLPTTTPPPIPGFETAIPAITAGALTAAQTGGAPNDNLTAKEIADYLRLAGLAAGLIGGGGGGGGGGGAAGSQAINPIFSAKLPTPGEGGAFKVGGLDYRTPPATDAYRYAMGPAMDIRAGTDLSKATSPYAGYGPGTLGEETFKRVTGMAQGGAMGYARGSSRDSFAVEGPGTGRSDDIPAVLSDGEYVIDAETVALLGDGSSKAGAKKLDEMRVKLRKHKGRNLAKGKFSVNAKRPEKYLSGGRT